MKKLVLAFVSVMLFSFAQAQSLESASTLKTDSTLNSSSKKMYVDYLGGWSDKTETFSLKFGIGSDNGAHFVLGIAGSNYAHFSTTNYHAGFGLQKSFIKSDYFLMKANIWPYIGWTTLEYDNEDKSETDFTYGASAQLEAGLRVYREKDGTDWFITVGYGITAPEFETKDIIENGSWLVGITARF